MQATNEARTAMGVGFRKSTPDLRADLFLNPTVTDAEAVKPLLAHEMTHVSTGIRVADRARSAGITDAPGQVMTDVYRAAEKQAPVVAGYPAYATNPFETHARTGQAAYSIPRGPGRHAQAELIARDPTYSAVQAADALNNSELVGQLLERRARSLPAARQIPKPPSLGDLLQQLDSRFIKR